MPYRLAWQALTLAAGIGLPMSLLAQVNHAFLAPDNGGFQTLHTLSLTVQADDSLQAVGPSHRSAVFNDAPFDISLAAFVAQDRAIMLHAEQVADGSGAANYTRFEPASWPLDGFRLKPRACVAVSREIVDAEHDLDWLRDRGFDPEGSIWIEQYFLSDDAFNNEVVLSLLVRADTCEQAPDAAFDALRGALQVARND